MADPLAHASLGEIVLYVQDVERAVEFYHGVLGLALERKAEGVAGVRGAGGTELVLHHGGEARSTGRPRFLLQFFVADIEASVRALRERGVDVSDVDVRPYGKYARFSDPEGNALGLEETAAGR